MVATPQSMLVATAPRVAEAASTQATARATGRCTKLYRTMAASSSPKVTANTGRPSLPL